MEHLALIFQLLQKHCLYPNKKKCQFVKDGIEYLGHRVTAKGVEADKEKIIATIEWPIPNNVKKLRGFLGLTGYHRRFVAGYNSIAAPLTRLTKKNEFMRYKEVTKGTKLSQESRMRHLNFRRS